MSLAVAAFFVSVHDLLLRALDLRCRGCSRDDWLGRYRHRRFREGLGLSRLDKYPGIMDVTDAGTDGVSVECASCGKAFSRFPRTLERMKAIDGFVTCSNSCRTAKLASSTPGTPCS